MPQTEIPRISTVKDLKIRMEAILNQGKSTFQDLAEIVVMDKNIVINALWEANKLCEKLGVEKPLSIDRIVSILGFSKIADIVRRTNVVSEPERAKEKRTNLVHSYAVAVLVAEIADTITGSEDEAGKYFLAGAVASTLRLERYRDVLDSCHEELLAIISYEGNFNNIYILSEAEYYVYQFEKGMQSSNFTEKEESHLYRLWKEACRKVGELIPLEDDSGSLF